MNSNTLVKAKQVTKIYKTGKVEVKALRGIDIEFKQADFVAIVGPSGSGKTTFLNLVGALDVVTEGELIVLDNNICKMSKHQRADLRLSSIGFVFQAYNLVPVLTAQENVEFVLELQGAGKQRAKQAKKVLGQLGLDEFSHRRPNELSGGQQQRVAIARAVAAEPKLVLADEPTANLDGENAEILLTMMRDLNENLGITFIFSTHDPRVVDYAHRVVTLVDGRIDKDIMKNPTTPSQNSEVLEN
jgi:putative ABC transport system ATP-binding protein